MCKESLVCELRAEVNKLKAAFKTVNEELDMWEKNGVLLTHEEKQCFYARYRDEWRTKRQKDSERAARELERLSTRILGKEEKNEKGV